MKKIVICLLLISMMLSVFAGCQKEEPKKLVASSPLLADYSDSILAVTCDETEYQMLDENKDTPPETMTVEFNGETYTGTYKSTLEDPYGSCWQYKYVGYCGDEKFLFRISSTTHKLVDFGWIDYEFDAQQKQLSEDERRAIADEFLIKQNRSDFVFEGKRNCTYGYVYDYVRTVSGINTVEFVAIWVSFDGTVYWYVERYFEEFDQKYDFSKIDLNALTEAIYQRLDTMTVDAKTYYDTVEYQEPKYELAVLKDGSIGLHCSATVETVKQVDEDLYEGSGAVFSFVVPLLVEDN